MHAALGDVNQTVPRGPWPDAIGPERAARAWAWKSILNAGGHVAFGSEFEEARHREPLRLGDRIHDDLDVFEGA